MNHSELIGKFVKGATYGSASNMYIEGDTLYSYGRHFPLLVRMDGWLLLNADKYSFTTSQHQSACFKHAKIQIPFSALHSAGIPLKAIELVDYETQRWDWTGKWLSYDIEADRSVLTNEEYKQLSEVEKEKCSKQEERRPESAVIRYDGKHYFSSMDGNNFFLCELPEPVETVVEAFASLKPKEVKDENFQRQGEWFFVETTDLPISISYDGAPLSVKKMLKFFYRNMVKNFVLPNRKTGGNLHVATRGIQLGDSVYVSGQIRHVSRWGGRGDHHMLKMSTLDDIKIFRAFENRALNSWSASGSID